MTVSADVLCVNRCIVAADVLGDCQKYLVIVPADILGDSQQMYWVTVSADILGCSASRCIV
jgi:hypothetical protein